jgi:heme exporter protein D
MGNLDGWDVALLVVAGYVALVALVRLMIRRRDQMLSEFRRKLKKEKQRKEAEERDRQHRRPQAA